MTPWHPALRASRPRTLSAVACIAVLAAMQLPAVASGTDSGVVQLSSTPLKLSSDWTRYLEAPTASTVRPVRIVRVAGAVTNAAALTRPGHGKGATLTYPPGGVRPTIVLDYGQVVGGLPTFDVTSTSGTVLQSDYSETLAHLTTDGSESVTDGSATTMTDGSTLGVRTDLFPVARPGSVTSANVQGGERYQALSLRSPGSVTLAAAGIVFTPPKQTAATIIGHFLSSDDLLNRIWYAGAYTLDLSLLAPGAPLMPGTTNDRWVILDGAKRDREVWSGDQLTAGLTDFYVADPRFARGSLDVLLGTPATVAAYAVPAQGVMSQPGPLPGLCALQPVMLRYCASFSASYSIVNVPALENYLRYTGDLDFVRSHWPAVTRQMAWDAQQVGPDGLFAVDATDSHNWNIETKDGELTYVNALYVQALHAAADMAQALGMPAQARSWRAAAADVTAAVNARLWNPHLGAYDASTTDRGTVVQDANVTAILAGIATPARARQILSVLQRALRSPYGPMTVASPAPSGYSQIVSPYMSGLQVLAAFATGDAPAALSTIRQEWGHMLRHDPGGVTWEKIQPDGTLAGGPNADSAAHAWSTVPTAAMSAYLLGVRPDSNGYRTWTIEPTPADLAWAQGSVPTPRGSLSVSWRRSGGHLVLTVTAPPGSSGTVVMPLLGRPRRIARDGVLVWSGSRALAHTDAHLTGDSVVFAAGPGTHTYAW